VFTSFSIGVIALLPALAAAVRSASAMAQTRSPTRRRPKPRGPEVGRSGAAVVRKQPVGLLPARPGRASCMSGKRAHKRGAAMSMALRHSTRAAPGSQEDELINACANMIAVALIAA
jgi:hypothetical protein